MQLPDSLTAEGRAAIIACLRIAAQIGELLGDNENDSFAETMGTGATDVPELKECSLPMQRKYVTTDEHAPEFHDDGSEIRESEYWA